MRETDREECIEGRERERERERGRERGGTNIHIVGVGGIFEKGGIQRGMI